MAERDSLRTLKSGLWFELALKDAKRQWRIVGLAAIKRTYNLRTLKSGLRFELAPKHAKRQVRIVRLAAMKRTNKFSDAQEGTAI